MKREGILLVVSGPSGVGKGTLIRELLSRHPEVTRSVSCTTRCARPGEQEGRDYRFVTPEQFAAMREAGELLEWATVHEHFSYGTPRGPVEDALARGQDIILEIDYQGARAVRQLMGHRAVLVFVAPPSWDALCHRLNGRETESAEDVSTRLRTARRELAHIDLFQYIIINDTVAEAAAELEAVLLAERVRLGRNHWQGLRDRILSEAEAGCG